MKSLGQVVHELGIASQLWRRARRRNTAVDATAPDEEGFRRSLGALLDAAPRGLVREHRFLRLPADRPPWTDTGLEVAEGERLSWIATGRTYLSRALDIWVEPHFQLWGRVGEQGPVFRGVRDTHTFSAPRAGRLSLASYFPGEWADPTGRLATPAADYRKVSGGMLLAVVRWAPNVAPHEGIAAIARGGDFRGLLAGELERLRSPLEPPPGWRHLWFVGPAEIFSSGVEDGERCIRCDTEADVAILQRDAPFALGPDTRLRWRWKVDALPSDLPEDTLPTHDYLSVAVEFENGQDLTYHWSAALPRDTIYRCPLPTWTSRETHWVLRSGADGLGRWHEEERPLLEDYRRAIRGPPPARIVRVWLIALSVFQRRRGRCAYARIALANASEVLAIS